MSAADMLAEILRLPAEERAEVDAGIAETMTVEEYRAHVRQRRIARTRR